MRRPYNMEIYEILQPSYKGDRWYYKMSITKCPKHFVINVIGPTNRCPRKKKLNIPL